jgi:hypothetical protein
MGIGGSNPPSVIRPDGYCRTFYVLEYQFRLEKKKLDSFVSKISVLDFRSISSSVGKLTTFLQVELAQSTSGQFHYLRVVFSSHLKSKIDNILVRLNLLEMSIDNLLSTINKNVYQ